MKEIWKDIGGYEGYYQVSDLGRVRSLDRVINIRGNPSNILGRNLLLFLRKDGYFQIRLSLNGVSKPYKVHRLVASEFCANPLRLNVVNHIDGNKSNNKPCNLEWCTPSHNLKHAIDIGLNRREKNVLHESKVLKIRELYLEGMAQHEISKLMDVPRPSVHNIVKQKTWKVLK